MLRCRYDLGSGGASLRSEHRVSVGVLHRVTATIDRRNATLSLDESPPVFGSSPGTLHSLDVQATIHIGHAPTAQRPSLYAAHRVSL